MITNENKSNWVPIVGILSFFLGVYYFLDFRVTLAEVQLYNYDNSFFLFLIPCRNILESLLLFSGIGLMFRYEWGRRVALLTYVYNIVFSIMAGVVITLNRINYIKEMHLGQNSNVGFWIDFILRALLLKIIISPIIPPILLFYYFTRPKIKEQFK